MAESLLNMPGLGFGAPFSSLSDQRRKVGGGGLSLNPLRVAQRREKEREEDRLLARENRDIALDDRKTNQDLAKARMAALYYQMGLKPDGSPLGGAGVLPASTRTGTQAVAPLTYGGTSGAVDGVSLQGILNPDGTVGFAQPTSPNPVAPAAPITAPVAVPAAAVGNPYLRLPNIGGMNVPSNIQALTGPARADAQQVDMGLRESAASQQALANARAAVQAVQAQQARANPDPWNRQVVGGNVVATTPSATITTTPSGTSTLNSQYGTGGATYGGQQPKSFTTTGADGLSYIAPDFAKWKEDQIGERALGRAAGSDADLSRAKIAASTAQGKSGFLDQLEQIHQNSLKKKT